jgi:hypothetical protein
MIEMIGIETIGMTEEIETMIEETVTILTEEIMIEGMIGMTARKNEDAVQLGNCLQPIIHQQGIRHL